MGGDLLAALDQLRRAMQAEPVDRAAVYDAVVIVLVAAGQVEAAGRVAGWEDAGG